ncbi:uncharacterized protein BJ171DRAFT_477677 [Polychytrium aggregatum]|uniref:uncharacterized protein n=1 Tax=Polychytrium aggregatum TaxID=110093 RepID=UPI0022FE64CD|nr:uncharacterized protein BJ171DRAFT_477677 [Polychytrium aggregatum]KAI9199377.1 hypothetical protein BJ171DRAFT_477677 [Polychytrium aggregatum]
MSAATDFDAFLDKHDLARNKTLLVDNEINSTDLVLSLTEPEMKQIGLKLGAIKKIQRAQRQNTEPPVAVHKSEPPVAVHKSEPLVAVHKSEPPPSKTPDGSENAVLPVVRYRPPPLARGWKCQLGNRDHEVFISYRVFSDEMPAIKLYAALKSSSQYDKNLCPYLDQLCLVDAMNWETGFINGLVNSQTTSSWR